MSQEQLDKLVKPLIKTAIKLKPVADDSAEKVCCDSKFGGSPYAEKGDTWPICPACNNELTFINQMRNETDKQLFVFYYCNECFPWGLGDEEKGQWVVRLYNDPSDEKTVPLRRNSDDEYSPVPCIVKTSTSEVLPDWEGLESVSEKVSGLCCELNDDSPWEIYSETVRRAGCLDEYASLLGGYPRYVQGEPRHTCPECDKEMEFYAQIDSEDEADIMWGDIGLVYFFRCPQHKNIFQLELQCH